MADQNLLDILQAHGERFLDSFSFPSTKLKSKNKKRKRPDDVSGSSIPSTLEKTSYDEEEWEGITEELADDNDDYSEFESISDDELMATGSYTDSKVVVFQDVSRSTEQYDSTSNSRSTGFMSSRISQLRQDDPRTVREKTKEEIDDERTNAQNDAILHRLVHTKLLSGSLDPDLDMTPAQRRKALAGRVLEVTGAARLGKGETSVRDMERNKASKRVRDGLKEKQKHRARQRLEEAKDLGNYHPTLKKLFEDAEAPSIKKRERGLKMGVGKFRDGFLHLGQEDFRTVNGAGRSMSRGLRRGRKGERGRG
ncbi:hypothetical protein H2248_006258 [Termitomyces sp. 'cryptogamus']|nr:hypothetical protein H2248_006258 [Termitomyces sp. 'cryptogamus']